MDEQLELYALGRLAESEQVFLEEHLFVCASCREKLDGIGDFVQGMRGAGTQTETTAVGARFFSPGWAAFLQRPAAAMALAFALLILVLGIFSIGRTKLVPVASLQLTAIRGTMPVTAPARTYDLLLYDVPLSASPYRVDVVDGAGGSVWSGLATAGQSGVEVNVPRHLAAGDYFVRVSAPDGKTLHEYGFRVH